MSRPFGWLFFLVELSVRVCKGYLVRRSVCLNGISWFFFFFGGDYIWK